MSRDQVHLEYIQKNIASVQRLVSAGKTAFMTDEDRQAAVLYYLQSLSTSSTQLSQTLRDSQPQIPWQQIRGFRNRIAHDYMNIDLELVWRIITDELTSLASAVAVLLASLPPTDLGSSDGF